MIKNKIYSGYKAYDYLEPGIDYKVFSLRKAIIEKWEYKVPLSKTEEDRFKELLEKNIVIDLHEHPCHYPDPIKYSPDLTLEGRQFFAYNALSKSGIDCIFDNLMDGRATINTKHGWDWLSSIHDLGTRLCDISQQDFVIQCKRVEDIKFAFKNRRLAWVPVLESSSCVENEVDRIDILYGLGIRSMGICYSESNMLGSGLRERRDGGLTDFGYDAVIRMNKVGMLIDVSHTGDRTALDTIEISNDPIIISHAGSRTLMPTKRMFPDEVLMAIADKKGLFAVEVAGFGVRTEKHPEGHIDGYMEHLEYCIEVCGIDHVGCGPDTMYGDHVGQYKVYNERYKTQGYGHCQRPDKDGAIEPQFPPIEYVRGMENPSECLINITRRLIKNGYSDNEISKIIGKNALNLLERVWH